MKLDNRGWGLREMIIYSCILLFFLLIAVYHVNYLYLSFDESSDSKEKVSQEKETVKEPEKNVDTIKYVDVNKYISYQEKMIEAGQNYLKDYNYDLSVSILTLDLNTLIEFDYIEKIYDQIDGSLCTGYVNIFEKDDGDYNISPFVRCTNYVTNSN